MGGGEGLAICPHCGFDLGCAEPVEDGAFSYSQTDGFQVEGRWLAAPRSVHELLGAILRARGSVLSRYVLAERLGYEGDDAGKLISVHLTRARRAILASGHAFPIETRRGAGLIWNPAAVPISHTKHVHAILAPEAA